MLIIYKASAGSGKTYQLAKEYIRNLIGVKPEDGQRYYLNLPKYNRGISEANNRHRYILAITFTNKATEEMKRRIIDELDALSKMPITVCGKVKDANYAKDLCTDFGCTREELAEASKKALRQLLNDYNYFHVTTIDSFFQRVLRTFARELDKQGDFSVELDDKMAVRTAVGIMLDDYNRNADRNPELGNWIYTYMVRQIERGSKSNFFNRKSHLYTTLISVVSNINEERFKPYSEKMALYLENGDKLNNLKKAISKKQKALIDRAKQIAIYTLLQLEANGVTLDQMKGNYANLRRVIADELCEGELVDPEYILGPTFAKMAEGLSDPFLKKYKVSPMDMDLFFSMFAQIREIYTEHEILADIYESIDQLALLRHAWQYLLTFINDNNLVLLADTNHLLKRIIGDSDTPFIYERMGVQFRNFLIDEFQDTSRMQWDNLRPLVSNGLTANNDSLIIGDEKQSIYRFRNSDSSLLYHQVAEVDFSPEITEIRGTAKGQNTNYRSAADIVRFNNTLFKTISERKAVEGFENVVQEISAQNIDKLGYIRFLPTGAKGDKSTESTEEGEPKDTLDIMAENIRTQHYNGGYAWSDIAILAAKNDEGAEAVERLIEKYPDIPVLSDEALFVRKSHAVQTIVGALKILANEQPVSLEPQPATGKKKYPTATEISIIMSRFTFFRSKGMTNKEALDCALDPQKPSHTGLHNCLEAIKKRKPSSLISLIETIINELIPPEERTSQISFLNAFQDYVVDYCSHNNQSLRAFLNDWENTKKTLSVSSAANVDAVKVMTIHKSKGLEFDCVHIPFGSWKETGRTRGQWLPFPTEAGLDPEICPPAVYLTFNNKYDYPGSYFRTQYQRDEHERLVDVMNMTYVAYTRAGRELTVYYNPAEGIGVTLAETLQSPTQAADPCLCSFAPYMDAETKAFVMGAPTHKSDTGCPKPDTGTLDAEDSSEEADAPDNTEEAATMTIDTYDVYYHTDAKVLTQVEDMLDTKADQTDDRDYENAFEIDEEARQRGVLMHDILAHVYEFGDIDSAIRRIALLHRLDKDRCDDARQFLSKMLDSSDQRVVRWFADNDKVLNEQSILLPDDYTPPKPRTDGKEVDFRRPDRLVFHDGGVDVIDYKFTTGVRSVHKDQIREYMDILKKMGYPKVKGYLWYPFAEKIIEIEDIPVSV